MSNSNVSPRFILAHKSTLQGLGKIALRSVGLSKSPSKDWQQVAPVQLRIKAPDNALVDQYVAWSGAPAERYRNSIPPHMVSQWGLAPVTDLLLQTEFPLAKVINQGVTLNVLGEIPRGQDLVINAKILSVHEDYSVARIAVQVNTGTQQQPLLVETTLHMAFILPNFVKSKKSSPQSTTTWQTVGTWRATGHDGLKFALLTGDFNPIHWVALAGRFSAFGGKVLHGFGMLVRTFEQLPQPIKSMDVRFLRPVLLPSSGLQVQVAEGAATGQQLRLLGKKDTVHLAGTFNV